LVAPDRAFAGDERLEELGRAGHAVLQAFDARDDELALDDQPVAVQGDLLD
jgi:hypothetical protein